jgi:hypothetical protein
MRKPIFFLFVLACGCAPTPQSMVSTLADKTIQEVYGQGDTVTVMAMAKAGNIVGWHFSDMGTWLYDTLDFPTPNLSNSRIEWKGSDFVSVRCSCGSPCWHSYVFPKKSGTKVKRFFYSVAADSLMNLILYQPEDLPDEYMFVVENLITSEKDSIPRIDCPSSISFLCLETVYFAGSELIVVWSKDFFEGAQVTIKSDTIHIPLRNHIILR